MNDTLASLTTPVTAYDINGVPLKEVDVEVNLDALFAQLRWEPVPVSEDAFWASQQVFIKSKVQVYRGIRLQVKKGQLEKATTVGVEEFLKEFVNTDRIGIHWSDNVKNPKKFSEWNDHYCQCATCTPYRWEPPYVKEAIGDERMGKVRGVWSCTSGCSTCKQMREEYLNGCRCNTCVNSGPHRCGTYCDSKSPCKSWLKVTAKDVANYTDANYMTSVAALFRGEVDIESTLLEGDKDYDSYRQKHGVYRYADEQEITLRYKSPVHISKVEIKNFHVQKNWKTDLTATV